MTAVAIAPSTEAGVLVANHLALARQLPKEVRTTTGGGTQSPTIAIPPGEASSCLLIRQQLIRVLAVPPSGGQCESFSIDFQVNLHIMIGPRWPCGKIPAAGPESPRLETRFHRRSGVYAGLLHVKSYVIAKRSPASVTRKLGEEGMPAQTSSSSPDRGSK
ncbi:hypothetical protein AVEN_24144-1 [Araneus ventricosus]|uniref:Uncharacterized protein n=1 Tax=Araneus ventricosus TaxID=182803 RepID=A0A4Y2KHV3_ARAVE|nr:hypothetical protein AVEN_24144-1 [Araneus ventricosus]